MRYPKMNKQPQRTVNMPQLSGGVNLRDSLTGIRDNQLTECVNMWYKCGMLRTRPAFVANENMSFATGAPHIFDIKTHSNIQNGSAVLMSAGKFNLVNGVWKWLIDFWWQYTDKNSYVGSVTFEKDYFCEEEQLPEIKRGCNYFVAEKDGTAYCYATDGETFCVKKLEYVSGAMQWTDIEETENYVPTVYVHCKRTGWDDFKGTQFEGYNLIGNSYKMIYSAYNEADSDKYHPMRYKLGQKLPKSGTIKADITIYDAELEETKTVHHEIKYTETEYNKFTAGELVKEYFGEGNSSPDGLRLFVKYNYVGFCFVSEKDGVEGHVFTVAVLDTDEKVKKYGCNEDNVVITAQYDLTDDWKKVFCMTRSTWFGGAANGINGGSRLFLCGNTEDKEKSLVVWSSLNNPLYFSENNYAYIGDKSQKVITFGQQGENLMIFKERSTYYTYYVTNDNITADNLINQTVVDYEANSVFFPMIQLNGSIGCDCPNTVQLCRNRLVWASSDGNVYTLYSNNQYSERTIYKVSEMVNAALSEENDLRNAASCDFEGHYLLAVGNKIYVMDYNSYGYQYASSFSKNEDSNTQIPWWIWKLDNKYGRFFELNNSLVYVDGFEFNDGITLGVCILKSEANDGEDYLFFGNYETDTADIEKGKIYSSIQTKLFDFSSGEILKNVNRVNVGFGDNGGNVINVSFVTNAGSSCESIVLNGVNTNECDAGFVKVKNFYPTMRSVRNFGIKIECEGLLIVEGVLLQFRLLGGAK